MTACGGAPPSSSYDREAAPQAPMYDNAGNAAGITEESKSTGYAYYGESAAIKETEKKKIINADANIQTENYMTDYEQIKSITIEAGGYVESANSYSSKNADLVLRIPAQNYERAKNAIISVGKLISFTENSEDVTQEYSDISLRLELKKTEEVRLLAMIAEQPLLKEKILLEQRLADIRAEIYYYDARIKAIENLSSHSTLNVRLTQVAGVVTETPRSFGERFGEAFKNSLASFARAIENVVLFLAGNFFQLLIALSVLGLACVVARKTIFIRRGKQE
jgi:hypothetical protein